jgi:flagellar FliJ protein
MRFRFSLESVLKHRTRLEEIAQREFAEAQRRVDECLRQIDVMYKRLDEVREDILLAQGKGSAEKIEEVREMETFIDGQKLRIERMRLQARELLQIAEEKQEALILAAQEKKILQRLKERRQLEHRQHMNVIEAKELDDLTMVRQAWRKK